MTIILLYYKTNIYNCCSSYPAGLQVSSLKLTQLSTAVQDYFSMGISAATTRAYKSGLHRYVTFCSEINHAPLPVSEETLLLFVTDLAQQNLSYATIQVYLQQCDTVMSQPVRLLLLIL